MRPSAFATASAVERAARRRGVRTRDAGAVARDEQRGNGRAAPLVDGGLAARVQVVPPQRAAGRAREIDGGNDALMQQQVIDRELMRLAVHRVAQRFDMRRAGRGERLDELHDTRAPPHAPREIEPLAENTATS